MRIGRPRNVLLGPFNVSLKKNYLMTTRTRRLTLVSVLLGLPLIALSFDSRLVVASDPALTIACMPDTKQHLDASVPVSVVRTVVGRSEPDEKGVRKFLIKEIVVENRSEKEVASVTVRWVVAPLNARVKSLQRGTLQPQVMVSHGKSLRPKERVTLVPTHPTVKEMLGTLLQQPHSYGNEFAILIGVSEILFADGLTWKEPLPDNADGKSGS